MKAFRGSSCVVPGWSLSESLAKSRSSPVIGEYCMAEWTLIHLWDWWPILLISVGNSKRNQRGWNFLLIADKQILRGHGMIFCIKWGHTHVIEGVTPHLISRYGLSDLTSFGVRSWRNKHVTTAWNLFLLSSHQNQLFFKQRVYPFPSRPKNTWKILSQSQLCLFIPICAEKRVGSSGY